MNIWMDIAIPALITDVVLAGLAIWAVLSRVTYIARADSELNAELSDRYTQETRVRVAWEKRAHEVEDERNELRTQLEEAADAYGKLEEKYSTLELGHKLMLAESDGAPKPKETAPKPKRNSRAKPPEKEG